LQAARGAGGFWAGDVCAESVERVVGDEATPDERPEGIHGFAWIAAAEGLVERIEEAGAGGFKNGEEFFFALSQGIDDGALQQEQGQLVGEKQSDASVAFADGLDACPRDFASRDESVEAGRLIVRDAGGKHRRLKQRCGKRRALEVFDGVEKRVEICVGAARGEKALPVSEKAGEGVLLDGFDFAAKTGE
jgi:hypothetical protein